MVLLTQAERPTGRLDVTDDMRVAAAPLAALLEADAAS